MAHQQYNRNEAFMSFMRFLYSQPFDDRNSHALILCWVFCSHMLQIRFHNGNVEYLQCSLFPLNMILFSESSCQMCTDIHMAIGYEWDCGV